jgi:hypothetical protein
MGNFTIRSSRFKTDIINMHHFRVHNKIINALVLFRYLLCKYVVVSVSCERLQMNMVSCRVEIRSALQCEVPDVRTDELFCPL